MSGSGRALLFDIDGTLADTDALHLKHSIKCSGLMAMCSIATAARKS